MQVQQIPAHRHQQQINGNGEDGWKNTYGTVITKPLNGTGSTSGYAYQTSYWGEKGNPVYTRNTGDGQAHENMPPFATLYMWKRTA